MTDIILLGPSPAVIANAGTLSTAMDVRQRPLSWLLLPAGWPVGTPLTVQAALTEAAPAEADWHDVVDRFGSAVTLAGAAGQLISVEPGFLMGFRFVRLKVAAALTGERSIQWGSWYLPG